MPKRFKQKQIQPDPEFNNILVAKFINQLMRRGKKTIARKIAYGAFEIIKKQSKQEPLDVFEKAISAVGPKVEVRPRRVGGATYQVPMEVKEKRRLSLAMRWLVEAAKKRKGESMDKRLAKEILAASNNEGEAVRKRINIGRMAAANRAFAHLARRRA